MVARLGQQRGLVTNALSKVVPLSMSSDFRLRMYFSAFAFKSCVARSSVRIRTMLGSFASAGCSGVFPCADERQATRKQTTTSVDTRRSTFFRGSFVRRTQRMLQY